MKEKRALIGASIFLGTVFIVSVLFLLRMSGGDDTTGGYAYIYQDGILLKTVSLETEDTFFVEGGNGVYNKIQIKDGSIGVIEASCPDFLCGRMGFIHQGPIPITCLPNRLVIEVKSGKEAMRSEGVDGVVY